MDDSIMFTPRPSAIPRLSKLPLPKPAQFSTLRAPSPTKVAVSRASSPTSTCSSSVSEFRKLGQSTQRQPATPQTALRPGLRHSVTQPHIPAPQSLRRPPLGQVKSLQTRPSPESLYNDAAQVYEVERSKVTRDPSQQENPTYVPYDGYVAEEEQASAWAGTGSLKLPRKTRPSLSERTIESLAHLPPSPATVRRKSGHCTPQKSITVRPLSTLGSSATRPKHEVAARAISPLKQSISSSPLKQSVLPKASNVRLRPTAAPISSPKKVVSRPASAASNFRASTTYGTVSKTLKARPTSIRPSLDGVFQGPQQTPQPRIPASKTALVASKPAQSSSAALREKIAQARAEQRKAIPRADSAVKLSPGSNEFETVLSGPQLEAQRTRQLVQKVNTARTDGRLNIAALGLKHIPKEVLTMYDGAAMEKSGVSWYEAVDLIRFIAADNEIEGIGDGVFPDVSKEALALEEESRGNQFGGLELLDLHGNMLMQIPMGLRRLEQLTTLNLSRNKLINSVFDIITQIPSLRELRLADNDLSREIPESIGSLVSLEILDVHGNRLSHLPTSMRELCHLRQLDVSKNRFTALPMDILSALPLTELYASHNGLFAALFPTSVNTFSKLQVLEVANNALATLSFDGVLQFPALQRLDVSNNRLNALPDISEWTALSVLLAEDNDLQSLPEGFTDLVGLRSASFRCNSIRVIDPEVAQMQGLEVLSLEGNPLREKRYLVMSVEEMKRHLEKKLDVEVDMF